MSEAVETRVARLEEKMNFLVQEATEAKAARKEQYRKNESDNLAIVSMAATLKIVEEKLAGQAPTIEEFITIKHKVVGAGKIGRTIWVIGSALIGAVSGILAFITWFKGT